MSHKAAKDKPNCKRRLDLSEDDSQIPNKGKKPMNTAVEISTQIGNAKQPIRKINKAQNEQIKLNKGEKLTGSAGKCNRETRSRNLRGNNAKIKSSDKLVSAKDPLMATGQNNNALPIQLGDSSLQSAAVKARKGNKSQKVDSQLEKDSGCIGTDKVAIPPVPEFDGVEVDVDVNINPLDDDFSMNEDDDNDETNDNDSEFSEVVIMPKKGSGPTQAEIDEEVEHWKTNPEVKNFFWDMFSDQFKEREEAMIQSVMERVAKNKTDADGNQPSTSKQNRHGSTSRSRGNTPNNKTKAQGRRAEIIKSPSDTTLYKPAFKVNTEGQAIIDKISNFVEGIRIESDHKRRSSPTVPPPSTPKQSRADGLMTGKEAAEIAILDADQNKVKTKSPRGELSQTEFKQLIRSLDDDDEFFHITCHIDSALRQKIQRGEFVDLEKLIPKDKCGGLITDNSDGKVELVSTGGHTFFKPVRECQINGLRKWEQAFRVYAAIYMESNPERSGEIWQYVHSINVAATSFQWHNVAYYDLTFRQLMAHKPNRSWAKLYNQGWNLAMRDPINNRSNGQGSSNGNNQNGSNNQKSWRDDCCWRYNRNRCHKSSCDWDHRCTYCGVGIMDFTIVGNV